ncbi:hypothetical protein Calag_0777 [Caldisphaera lagunensis DSM 15908]|uniref:Uncharacterized protein n=1 Tax=Caldisphaera lagunensis (strain DSM 15908 / JCM 11604 / ANMR 0165 / IC-154) TaxID=1056495 RepID=L0AAR9_CALLD|nr:hypothetical protein [Caldisphaera lagunensis]AFZ70519.1 hypothetical protein Calag_0777 [Caldisphaera lagunensis DSM 15908]
MVELHPVGILAESNCFYIAAPIINAPWKPNENIEKIISNIINELKAWDISNYNLTKIEKAIYFSTIYGGLTLIYTCDPIVAISRIHTNISLSLKNSENNETKIMKDEDLLKAWAIIFNGNETEGLKILSGNLVFPKDYKWDIGGEYKIAARGIKY